MNVVCYSYAANLDSYYYVKKETKDRCENNHLYTSLKDNQGLTKTYYCAANDYYEFVTTSLPTT